MTVGHGTLQQDRFAELLQGAGVEWLVDVRRAPGSRRHPHFSRAALEEWLPRAGTGYAWEGGLGGWRKPLTDSPNQALRNASFRGYADYMLTPPFWEALDGVLAGAAARRTVVMCSEAVYWRCHRRLISDAAQLVGKVTVRHVGHDGRITDHRLTEGVRAEGDLLLYDGGTLTLPTP